MSNATASSFSAAYGPALLRTSRPLGSSQTVQPWPSPHRAASAAKLSNIAGQRCPRAGPPKAAARSRHSACSCCSCVARRSGLWPFVADPLLGLEEAELATVCSIPGSSPRAAAPQAAIQRRTSAAAFSATFPSRSSGAGPWPAARRCARHGDQDSKAWKQVGQRKHGPSKAVDGGPEASSFSARGGALEEVAGAAP